MNLGLWSTLGLSVSREEFKGVAESLKIAYHSLGGNERKVVNEHRMSVEKNHDIPFSLSFYHSLLTHITSHLPKGWKNPYIKAW